MAQTRGIDISRHQGSVNWDRIQEAYDRGELGFVIIRAGYGGGGVDDQFARNWAEARRRGIPHQAYFYAYPGRSGGREQAEEFFARVGALQAGESISLDIEDDPTFGRNLVASDVQWCLEFLNRSKELFGVKGLIYMNSNVLSRYDWSPVVEGDYGLWIANYGPNNGQPNGDGPSSGEWPFWAIWQFTSRGNLGGISPVDINIFSGSKEAFLKYGLQGSAPQPTPAPTPTPAPAPKPAASYTVQKGDNLSAIAQRAGTSWQALYAANKSVIGPNPNIIKPGQVLVIPNGSSPAPAPSGPTQHIVVRGDTLGKLSARYSTAVDTIVSWNKSKYPKMTRDYIQAGWVIRVK